MEIFDNINQDGENEEKIADFYEKDVKVDEWLNLPFQNCIIKFKDRTEYKKNGVYHRLNGPAIDYNDPEKDKYYFQGECYKDLKKWKKVTNKVVRKLKIKKLNQSETKE